MVYEVGGGIGHSAPTARGAEATALAREGDEAVAATGVAVHAHESVGEHAAFEISTQPSFDEARGRRALFAGI